MQNLSAEVLESMWPWRPLPDDTATVSIDVAMKVRWFFFARMCIADGGSWEQRGGSSIVERDASAYMASRSTGPEAEVTTM